MVESLDDTSIVRETPGREFYNKHCYYLPAMLGWFFFSAILSKSIVPRSDTGCELSSHPTSFFEIFFLINPLFNLSRQPIERFLQQICFWRESHEIPMSASVDNYSLFGSVALCSCCLRMLSGKIGNETCNGHVLERMGVG